MITRRNLIMGLPIVAMPYPQTKKRELVPTANLKWQSNGVLLQFYIPLGTMNWGRRPEDIPEGEWRIV